MIELPLPRSRSFNDLIRAGSASPLLVKQVGSSANNPQPGLCTSCKLSSHGCPSTVPSGTAWPSAVHRYRCLPSRILYLISVYSITIKPDALAVYGRLAGKTKVRGTAPPTLDCTLKY